MTSDLLRFSGQAAIVTGGADGIGKAVACRLASEGAEVTIFDLDEQKLTTAQDQFNERGLSITGKKVDVGEENAVWENIATAAARSGRLDILVHCAGIVGPNGVKTTEVSVDEFDMVYRVEYPNAFERL